MLWFGRIRSVSIYEMDGTPLLGMKLMQNCRLTMDIVPDGQFELIPLEEIPE